MLVTFRPALFFKILIFVGIASVVWTLSLTARSAPTDRSATPPEVQRTESPTEDGVYRVDGTGGAGLNLRSCAGIHCSRVGAVREGETLRVSCWRAGRSGDLERKWFRATRDGAPVYAAGRYLDAETGASTPQCGSTASSAAKKEASSASRRAG